MNTRHSFGNALACLVAVLCCVPLMREWNHERIVKVNATVNDGGFTLHPLHDVKVDVPPWKGHLEVPRGVGFTIERADATPISHHWFELECRQWRYRDTIRDRDGRVVAKICSSSTSLIAVVPG